MKRYLGLSEEEIADNEKLWKEERDQPDLSTQGGQDLRSVGISPADIEADITAGEEIAGAAGAPEGAVAPMAPGMAGAPGAAAAGAGPAGKAKDTRVHRSKNPTGNRTRSGGGLGGLNKANR